MAVKLKEDAVAKDFTIAVTDVLLTSTHTYSCMLSTS